MNVLSSTLLIIPSYNPPENFPEFCKDLLDQGFPKIIVVNDGSLPEFQRVFDRLKRSEVEVLKHERNLGKGHAIRTGLEHFVFHEVTFEYCVFCDDDGQHLPKDVARVSIAGIQAQSDFAIGTRSLKQMPLKSRIGNLISRKLLGKIYGLSLPDTQSGLRFFSNKLARSFLDVRSDRFRFELDCLKLLNRRGYAILSVPIETVYFEENAYTRFKLFRDSLDVLKSLLFRNHD